MSETRTAKPLYGKKQVEKVSTFLVPLGDKILQEIGFCMVLK